MKASLEARVEAAIMDMATAETTLQAQQGWWRANALRIELRDRIRRKDMAAFNLLKQLDGQGLRAIASKESA